MGQSDTRLRRLDGIRGFAAIYVVCHHLARVFLAHRWYRLPFVFGPEAVMMFFLLSGFVIYYSVSLNPIDLMAGNYAVKRIRRIYPIFISAMILGYLCQCLINRAMFVPDLKMLFGNLLMMQGRAIDPFYNGPLWSLSYEWWFYVIFFVLIKSQKRIERQRLWVAAMAVIGISICLVVPNQPSLFLLYFPIWWSGAELARQYVAEGRVSWRFQVVPMAMLGGATMLSLLLVVAGLRRGEPLLFIEYPFLYFRHFASALVLVIAGLAWYRYRFIGLNQAFRVFSVAAPISYGIYAVHGPVIYAADSFSPGKYVVTKVAAIVITILTLAYLLELKLQPLVNRLSNRFLGGADPSIAEPDLVGRVDSFSDPVHAHLTGDSMMARTQAE